MTTPNQPGGWERLRGEQPSEVVWLGVGRGCRLPDVLLGQKTGLF